MTRSPSTTFGDFLVCGISTQLQQSVQGFDEVLSRLDPDFVASGVVAESVIRLGFLAVLPRRRILGSIGTIGRERHARLIGALSAHLVANLGPR